MKLEVSRQFFFPKNLQILDFMKILLVGAELFHADRRMYGRTDRHEANIRFSQFGESAPKMRYLHTLYLFFL